jgi:hypothetical protein
MHFVHFLMKIKQVHNLKNRVFPQIISNYLENPRPTFFVNSLENSTIPILYEKNHVPPFYLIFTSENHLNAHSSLIKQHMAMNFAPLDCPCQGASSESKKIYLDFFISEKIAKNQKIHIFGSHSKKWVQWPELLLYLNSTDPIQ